MAIPILEIWKQYFTVSRDEGLGSSYERIVLNEKLFQVIRHYDVKTCLEAPCFGFTGLSGINSMGLGLKGVSVSLVDHDSERVALIEKIWHELNLPVQIVFQKDYSQLPFADKAFDFSWNFSALWFVSDLTQFLASLTRVTKKVILLCVPNRLGFGYISQKYFSGKKLCHYLNEVNIVPQQFCSIMSDLGWQRVDVNYIDAPPWPDIGMKKEDLLRKIGINLKTKLSDPLSILDYYSGHNPNFASDMLKHYWFEQYAPVWVKYFWAHHRYFLFEPVRKN
jgi:hypothetical protein